VLFAPRLGTRGGTNSRACQKLVHLRTSIARRTCGVRPSKAKVLERKIAHLLEPRASLAFTRNHRRIRDKITVVMTWPDELRNGRIRASSVTPQIVALR
jgi:hypothetical protein